MNRLKELRVAKGFKTQKEFAEAMNLSKSTYNYWENGTIEIDNQSLFRFADYFGVSIDYILGRDIELLHIPDNLKGIPVAFHNGIEDLSQDDIDDVAKFIEFLKAKNKK